MNTYSMRINMRPLCVCTRRQKVINTVDNSKNLLKWIRTHTHTHLRIVNSIRLVWLTASFNSIQNIDVKWDLCTSIHRMSWMSLNGNFYTKWIDHYYLMCHSYFSFVLCERNNSSSFFCCCVLALRKIQVYKVSKTRFYLKCIE